jgi:hypothetical protein
VAGDVARGHRVIKGKETASNDGGGAVYAIAGDYDSERVGESSGLESSIQRPVIPADVYVGSSSYEANIFADSSLRPSCYRTW